MSPPPAVEAARVCRRFGRRWALVDVSFELEAGRTLLLTGRNGSGKSTLLRVLATALRPHRGSARVGGQDVLLQRDEVRDRVTLLGHYSNLYEPLTARENLRVVAGFLPPERRAELDAALERVGLADRADDVVAGFSAGMRKRLQLARLLLKRAPLALLDEPFAALDAAGARLVEALIDEHRARGGSLVIATHLLERGRALGDAALALEAGRVVWSGAARDLPPAEPGP